MKKLLLIICLLIFCGVVCAQSKHFVFKGVSIDGEEQKFIQKLELQGYEKFSDVNMPVLSGSFMGKNSNIMIYSTPITNIVWKVMVVFDRTYETWSEIKITYNRLIDLYTQKYGSPTFDIKKFTNPFNEGDGFELEALKHGTCIYGTGFAVMNDAEEVGYIIIEMSKTCQIWIHYEDKINSDLREKEEMQDI